MAEQQDPIYVISADTVEGLMAAVRRVQLKKEFLISKNALYDYYSTNSGIFAANPSISGQSESGGGGGGGGGGCDCEKKIEALSNQVKVNTDAIADMADDVETSLSASIGALTIAEGISGDVETANENASEALAAATSAVADVDLLKQAINNAAGMMTFPNTREDPTRGIVGSRANEYDETEGFDDIQEIVDATITLRDAFKEMSATISAN